jgi:hypothetical protein
MKTELQDKGILPYLVVGCGRVPACSGVGLCGTPVGRCCTPRLSACTYYPSRWATVHSGKPPIFLSCASPLLNILITLHTIYEGYVVLYTKRYMPSTIRVYFFSLHIFSQISLYMYRLFVAATLVLLFTQCGEKYIFSQSNTLPNFGWTWSNVQQFDLQLNDTTQRYDILLDITHTPDFPYENIYLKIGTQMPDGKKTIKTFKYLSCR